MVRLGYNFACTALLAMALAVTAYGAATTQAQSPDATKTAAASATPAKATSAHPTRTHHKKKVEPVAEVPQPPPPPPTLEQQSPTAPQVIYRNGLLTIDAPNSTLSSILHAVQAQTGATMDVPAGAGNDRVAMQLGPGEPRDVLHTLLNGSKFDYMILGVAGQPGAIQKVILTPKTAGGATTQAANTPQPTASEEPQDDTADNGGESEYPGGSEQQPMAPGAFRRPMGGPGGQAYQQQNPGAYGQQPGQADPNIVKTPEQLMQELQQMQQQQQQYMDQLNPANQNPPQ